MSLTHITDDFDLIEALAFAKQIASEAGRMIRQARESNAHQVETKLNATDLVTQTDKAVEAYIRGEIAKKYPDHLFMGEETYVGQAFDYGADLDRPIDGTTNFVHGFHEVATSIGLAINGKPVLGVVYNPFLNEMYHAISGHGAYLNDALLSLGTDPRPLTSLSNAMIGVDSNPFREPEILQPKFDSFRRLVARPIDQEGGKMVKSLRIIGSCALSMMYVAKGSLDMYWENGAWLWDVCAGICILREAGGAAFGGNDSNLSNQIDAELLAGRKYLFIRAIQPSEPEKTHSQVQTRFAREIYLTIQDVPLAVSPFNRTPIAANPGTIKVDLSINMARGNTAHVQDGNSCNNDLLDWNVIPAGGGGGIERDGGDGKASEAQTLVSIDSIQCQFVAGVNDTGVGRGNLEMTIIE